jgi:hypothetical protein
MSLTYSIHDRVKVEPRSAILRRAARVSGAKQRPFHDVVVHRSTLIEQSTAPTIEPTLSIEEMIRRFTEEQPPQLYRGGA